MYQTSIRPRFNDTDALGHINNAMYATWFEEARRKIFEVFVPDLDPKKWNLIIARIEIDFLKQGDYGPEVTIETEFEKIGNSSLIIVQRAVQEGDIIAQGKAVMVHFNYEQQKSQPIPEDIKAKLQAF